MIDYAIALAHGNPSGFFFIVIIGLTMFGALLVDGPRRHD